jgi:RNA polymerase sigma factor (sigma-70 family)
MKLIIKDLDEQKLSNNKTFENKDPDTEMFSLDEYLSIAQKCIAHFANRDLRTQMLKSEDAISFVAEHLMFATCRWSPQRGRTLRSYHNQCAIWAIQNWVSRLAKTKDILSIHKDLNDDESSLQLYEILEDKRDLSFSDTKHREKREEIRLIIDKSKLSQVEKACLVKRFLDHMEVKEISKDISKGEKFVYSIIDRAVKKLRKSCVPQM